MSKVRFCQNPGCKKELVGNQRKWCSGRCKQKIQRKDPQYREMEKKCAKKWCEKNREHLKKYKQLPHIKLSRKNQQ